ncbi:hypothetical protein C789_956 [Microcystis aeruginosa FACHB-905 = DIANCHI905]|nr:hypothetical protein C789_956 [Microcystis aeruginosa FACHB-905 = DIANCHI905]
MISSLYSLEKLIEWKLVKSLISLSIIKPLYSLEKLIEWKQWKHKVTPN